MLKHCFLLLSLSLLGSSCVLLPEPHRIEIIQGKKIKADAVQKLRLGMTEEQVQFLIGSPDLRNIFNPNRWDYVYYADKQDEALIKQQLALFFNNGILQRAVSKDFDVAHLQTPSAVETTPATTQTE